MYSMFYICTLLVGVTETKLNIDKININNINIFYNLYISILALKYPVSREIS